MRRVFLVVAAAALLAVRVPVHAADDFLYSRFGDYLDALRTQTGIPGLAAAIVGKNDILWADGFGYQDVERAIPIRTDTPMQLDGIPEVLTASLVLECVDDGHLSLDDRIGQFKASSPDADATIRQVLTHTSGSSANPVYDYRPERIDALSAAVRSCTDDSYRETLANQFDRLAMSDSVPGLDVLDLVPPAEGVLKSEFERYSRVLKRLAIPYTVDSRRKAKPSKYSATTLTPSSGAIATVEDMAEFDLALKDGELVRPGTLADAWRAPTNADGQRLPHGIGWFVQTFNGESVVWQFGSEENGSSSLMITLPSRGLTLVLLANSNGLAKSLDLRSGDVTVSPFGRLFLGTFIR